MKIQPIIFNKPYYRANKLSIKKEIFFASKPHGSDTFERQKVDNNDINLSKENLDCIHNVLFFLKNTGKDSIHKDELLKIYNSLDLFDKKALNSWVREIDYQKMLDMAPDIRNFDTEKAIKFISYHHTKPAKAIENGSMEIKNFSQYLEKNYINADKMDELLTIYPQTSRNIGKIPNAWLDKTKNRLKAQEEIYDLINFFNSKILYCEDIQRDFYCKDFGRTLSQIINKDSKIYFYDKGSYGEVFLIQIENGGKYCLKLFEPTLKRTGKLYKSHGASIEPQNAIFVNKHSKDYVKMYFAKVASRNQNDAFLVTQFLDKGIIPQDTVEENDKRYLIKCDDISFFKTDHHNIVCSKIVDFGDIKVYDRKTKKHL